MSCLLEGGGSVDLVVGERFVVESIYTQFFCGNLIQRFYSRSDGEIFRGVFCT